MPVGVKVTLRGDRMYEFLDRLITSTLPRVRDFNGISEKGFDGRGNYTMGIKEQIAFLKLVLIKYLKLLNGHTLQIQIQMKMQMILLKELGMPFKMNDRSKKKVSENLNKNEEEQVVESIEENKNDEFEKNKNIES